MEITKADFANFNLDNYTFKYLKSVLEPEEVQDLKDRYQKHWQHFKDLQLATRCQLTLPLTAPKVESWTNGWNLRTHFWCPYRQLQKETSAPCLAVQLNRKNLRAYLMFQHYRSENSPVKPQDYNALLDVLKETVASWEDRAHYFIWTNQDSELADYWPLLDYLANPQLQAQLQGKLGPDTTFQVGWLLEKSDAQDIEVTLAQHLTQLFQLYQQLP